MPGIPAATVKLPAPSEEIPLIETTQPLIAEWGATAEGVPAYTLDPPVRPRPRTYFADARPYSDPQPVHDKPLASQPDPIPGLTPAVGEQNFPGFPERPAEDLLTGLFENEDRWILEPGEDWLDQVLQDLPELKIS